MCQTVKRCGSRRGGPATGIRQFLCKRQQKNAGAQAQHDERTDARIDQRRGGGGRHGPGPRAALGCAQDRA
ncbi:hypothetical protein G6F63_014032 [Rhizopus arrhizus]|nr:hypothetical protein G6F31_021596 [Rhizopus arrhizus]KAG1245699.1 hypothetical protein G6F65_021089 [Rhizopus arrhizus]KAG1320910.1 hypothetical protein G6F63_014032 [Rhizopus arrhizus]KAG1486889.1 hypothetical protein G6F52_014252 [Rhizopus delemar]